MCVNQEKEFTILELLKKYDSNFKFNMKCYCCHKNSSTTILEFQKLYDYEDRCSELEVYYHEVFQILHECLHCKSIFSEKYFCINGYSEGGAYKNVGYNSKILGSVRYIDPLFLKNCPMYYQSIQNLIVSKNIIAPTNYSILLRYVIENLVYEYLKLEFDLTINDQKQLLKTVKKYIGNDHSFTKMLEMGLYFGNDSAHNMKNKWRNNEVSDLEDILHQLEVYILTKLQEKEGLISIEELANTSKKKGLTIYK